MATIRIQSLLKIKRPAAPKTAHDDGNPRELRRSGRTLSASSDFDEPDSPTTSDDVASFSSSNDADSPNSSAPVESEDDAGMITPLEPRVQMQSRLYE